MDGWRRVTDAVHAAGGRMVLQLWHVGRMSHASFHADGLPVAPSALSPKRRSGWSATTVSAAWSTAPYRAH